MRDKQQAGAYASDAVLPAWAVIHVRALTVVSRHRTALSADSRRSGPVGYGNARLSVCGRLPLKSAPRQHPEENGRRECKSRITSLQYLIVCRKIHKHDNKE